MRIHRGPAAAGLTEYYSARAFTYGSHIVLGARTPGLETIDGRRLLAHELTHTLQQASPFARGDISAEARPRGPPSGASRLAVQRTAGLGVQCDITDVSLSDVTGAVVDFGVGAYHTARDYGGAAIDVAAEGFETVVEYFAPGLLAFVRGGYVGQLTDLFCTGLDSLVGSLISPLEDIDIVSTIENTFNSLTNGVNDVKNAIGSAASTAIGALMRPIVEAIQVYGDPIIQGIASVADTIEGIFTGLWDNIAVPVLDFLGTVGGAIWSAFNDLITWIEDITAPLRAAAEWAWNELCEEFNLAWNATGGIRKWISDTAQDLWKTFQDTIEPIKTPLMVVGGILLLLSPFGPIIIVTQVVPPLYDKLVWLWNNWNTDDILVQAREILAHDILPAIIGTVSTVSSAIAGAISWLAGLTADVSNAFGGVLSVFGANHCLTAVTRVLNHIADQFKRLAAWANGGFKGLGDAVTAVFNAIVAIFEPILDFLVRLLIAASNPPMIPVALAAAIWLLCPDELKPPVIDFVIDLLIQFTRLFSAFMVSLWPLNVFMKEAAIGFLEELRGNSTDDTARKIAVTNKIANLLAGGGLRFAAGFVVGLLEGLLDGILDPFRIIIMIVQLVAAICRALGNVIGPLIARASPTVGGVINDYRTSLGATPFATGTDTAAGAGATGSGASAPLASAGGGLAAGATTTPEAATPEAAPSTGPPPEVAAEIERYRAAAIASAQYASPRPHRAYSHRTIPVAPTVASDAATATTASSAGPTETLSHATAPDAADASAGAPTSSSDAGVGPPATPAQQALTQDQALADLVGSGPLPTNEDVVAALSPDMAGDLSQSGAELSDSVGGGEAEVSGEMSATGGSPRSLSQVLGDLWDTALTGAANLGARIARALMEFIMQSDYELGRKVGYVAGFVLFQVILAYFTAGISAEAEACSPILKAIVRFLDLGGEILGLIGKAAGRVAPMIMRFLGPVGRFLGRFRFIDRIMSVVMRAVRGLARFGERAGGAVVGAARRFTDPLGAAAMRAVGFKPSAIAHVMAGAERHLVGDAATSALSHEGGTAAARGAPVVGHEAGTVASTERRALGDTAEHGGSTAATDTNRAARDAGEPGAAGRSADEADSAASREAREADDAARRESQEAADLARRKEAEMPRAMIEMRAFCAANDAIDTPKDLLIAGLYAMFGERYPWIRRFYYRNLPIPHHYRIVFEASPPHEIDDDYSDDDELPAGPRRTSLGIDVEDDIASGRLSVVQSPHGPAARAPVPPRGARPRVLLDDGRIIEVDPAVIQQQFGRNLRSRNPQAIGERLHFGDQHGTIIGSGEVGFTPGGRPRIAAPETPGVRSVAPIDHPTLHIDYTTRPDVVPPGIVLEFPGGQRVWRQADGSIAHEVTVGPSSYRRGFEHQYPGVRDTGLPSRSSGSVDLADVSGRGRGAARPRGAGYHRAHMHGQGTGFESPFAIPYASDEINLVIQNDGIEEAMRAMRESLPEGAALHVRTESRVVPGTNRFREAVYRVDYTSPSGEAQRLFEFTIGSDGTIANPRPFVELPEVFNPQVADMLDELGIPERAAARAERIRQATQAARAGRRGVRRAALGPAPAAAPPTVNATVSSPGRPLGSPLRSQMEHAFDANFSAVRVHDGPAASASAAAINAAAYQVGNHVVLGGSTRLGSARGRRLLAHELSHVAEAAPMPAVPGPLPIEQDPGAETRATAAARSIAAGDRPPPRASALPTAVRCEPIVTDDSTSDDFEYQVLEEEDPLYKWVNYEDAMQKNRMWYDLLELAGVNPFFPYEPYEFPIAFTNRVVKWQLGAKKAKLAEVVFAAEDQKSQDSAGRIADAIADADKKLASGKAKPGQTINADGVLGARTFWLMLAAASLAKTDSNKAILVKQGVDVSVLEPLMDDRSDTWGAAWRAVHAYLFTPPQFRATWPIVVRSDLALTTFEKMFALGDANRKWLESMFFPKGPPTEPELKDEDYLAILARGYLDQAFDGIAALFEVDRRYFHNVDIERLIQAKHPDWKKNFDLRMGFADWQSAEKLVTDFSLTVPTDAKAQATYTKLQAQESSPNPGTLSNSQPTLAVLAVVFNLPDHDASFWEETAQNYVAEKKALEESAQKATEEHLAGLQKKFEGRMAGEPDIKKDDAMAFLELLVGDTFTTAQTEAVDFQKKDAAKNSVEIISKPQDSTAGGKAKELYTQAEKEGFLVVQLGDKTDSRFPLPFPQIQTSRKNGGKNGKHPLAFDLIDTPHAAMHYYSPHRFTARTKGEGGSEVAIGRYEKTFDSRDPKSGSGNAWEDWKFMLTDEYATFDPVLIEIREFNPDAGQLVRLGRQIGGTDRIVIRHVWTLGNSLPELSKTLWSAQGTVNLMGWIDAIMTLTALGSLFAAPFVAAGEAATTVAAEELGEAAITAAMRKALVTALKRFIIQEAIGEGLGRLTYIINDDPNIPSGLKKAWNGLMIAVLIYGVGKTVAHGIKSFKTTGSAAFRAELATLEAQLAADAKTGSKEVSVAEQAAEADIRQKTKEKFTEAVGDNAGPESGPARVRTDDPRVTDVVGDKVEPVSASAKLSEVLGADAAKALAEKASPTTLERLAALRDDAVIKKLVESLTPELLEQALRTVAPEVLLKLGQKAEGPVLKGLLEAFAGSTGGVDLLHAFSGDPARLSTLLEKIGSKRLIAIAGNPGAAKFQRMAAKVDPAAVADTLKNIAGKPDTQLARFRQLITDLGPEGAADVLNTYTGAEIKSRWRPKEGMSAAQNLGRLAIQRSAPTKARLASGIPVPVERPRTVHLLAADFRAFFAIGPEATLPGSIRRLVNLVQEASAKAANHLNELIERSAAGKLTDADLKALPPNARATVEAFLKASAQDGNRHALYGSALQYMAEGELRAQFGGQLPPGVALRRTEVRNGKTLIPDAQLELTLDKDLRYPQNNTTERAVIDWTTSGEAGKITKYRGGKPPVTYAVEIIQPGPPPVPEPTKTPLIVVPSMPDSPPDTKTDLNPKK